MLQDTVSLCLGDSATLELKHYFDNTTLVNWTTPYGIVTNANKISAHKAGKYFVKITSPNFASALIDSSYVKLYAMPKRMLRDTTVCKEKSILLDAKLAFSCVGLANLNKALARESKIKKLHPNELFYYLWFIGVDPSEQNKGIGTVLLKDVINESVALKRPIYLETSTLKNIPWYEKFGFSVYRKLDVGYELFCMKKE